jgi:magnesium chelatase family protein
VSRYLGRISGPLYDRFDIQLAVPSVAWAEMAGLDPGESSATVRRRVEAARGIQRRRMGGGAAAANAYLSPRQLRAWCRAGPEVDALLARAADRLGFSARAIHRVLKLARTIADLRAAESIAPADVAEALQYRNLDRITGRLVGPPAGRGSPRAG